MLGESDVVLTGGAENMSQAPYALRNVRWGTALGQDLKVRSTNWMRPTEITKWDMSHDHYIPPQSVLVCV